MDTTASMADKIKKASELKEEGNKHFKDADWKKALQKYHFAWLNIKGLGETASAFMPAGGPAGADSTLSPAEKSEVKSLTESLHLNLAACYLQTEQYAKCIAASTTAIGVNANSAKGYFRRGQAYLKQRDIDNAERDVKKAANLSPGDASIRKTLQQIGAEKKRQNQKQAKTFKGFFDKVELYDDKAGAADAGEPPSKRDREEGPDDLSRADDGDSEPLVDASASNAQLEEGALAAAAAQPTADVVMEDALPVHEEAHSDPRAMD